MASGFLFNSNSGNKNSADVFHVLNRTSRNQRCVSLLSNGTEIISYADTDDRAFHIKQAVQTMVHNKMIRYALNVDSKFLCDTITQFHEEKVTGVLKTVQLITNLFHSDELGAL